MLPKHVFHFCIATVLLISGSARAELAPASPAPASEPADKLSLEPQVSPVPDTLVLGSRRSDDARQDLELKGILDLSLPQVEGKTVFDLVGEVIDAQDTFGPLGTTTSAHFEMPGDKIGKWSPFLSVAQEADEVDAHVRNGIGVGLTYRFNHNARVDIEAMYLESAEDFNPNLGAEGRIGIVFSFGF